jgi:hypothetical protein
MSSEAERDPDDGKGEKKPYVPPSLTLLGSVKQLTAGGAGSKPEGMAMILQRRRP